MAVKNGAVHLALGGSQLFSSAPSVPALSFLEPEQMTFHDPVLYCSHTCSPEARDLNHVDNTSDYFNSIPRLILFMGELHRLQL